MNIQIQKAERDAAQALGLNLDAYARVMEMTAQRAARRKARVMVKALCEGLALICTRVAREPGRVAYAAGLKRQARLDRARVRRLQGEVGALRLDKAALRIIRQAAALEAKAGRSGGVDARALRAQATRLRMDVEEARAKAEAERGADQRMAETVRLEADREGVADVVERRRGHDHVRLRTRDGLVLMHERGGLGARTGVQSRRLMAAGLHYRDRYEAAASSLRSCLGESERVAVQRNVWMEAKAASRRAATGNRVRRLEMAVASRHGGEALEVLRAVAGEGRTISSMNSGRRRQVRLANLLRASLATVAEMIERGS